MNVNLMMIVFVALLRVESDESLELLIDIVSEMHNVVD